MTNLKNRLPLSSFRLQCIYGFLRIWIDGLLYTVHLLLSGLIFYLIFRISSTSMFHFGAFVRTAETRIYKINDDYISRGREINWISSKYYREGYEIAGSIKPIPRRSWHRLSCGADIQVSSHEKHRQCEEARSRQYHGLRRSPETPKNNTNNIGKFSNSMDG